MGYGAQARRVDADSASLVEDVDFNKVGLLCRTERGIEGLHKGIFTYGMFEAVAGSFMSGAYGAYVSRSFFDTKKTENRVEMMVASPVAADAVQAVGTLENSANDSLTLKAANRGDNDKSLFGNRIGYTVENTEELEYTLTSDISITGTAAILNSVDNLEVGYYIHIEDGTEDDVKKILTLDRATKTVTFSALTNAAPETVALTSIKRSDYTLKISLKDYNEVWFNKENYERIPFQDDHALIISTLVEKSDYVIGLAVSFSEVDAAALLVDVATETPLASGSDGTPPGVSDYNGITSLFNDSGAAILLSPELSTIEHNQNMLIYVNDKTKMMYYANEAEGSDQSALQNFGGSLRGPITFGMVPADKWFSMSDPINPGFMKPIPNVGIAAAHFFNSYEKNGIGKVAAGNRDIVDTPLKPIDNGLVHNDSDGIGDLLIRDYSINICRWRQGKGTTINSARTISTDKGYIFQNQVMGWLLIKRSILDYLEGIEQDQSGGNAQEIHYNAVWTYLKGKYDEGVFYRGNKEDGTPTEMKDVVTIVNDFSINSLADIANGIETMFVQVVFVPPIEEPILELASAPVTSI